MANIIQGTNGNDTLICASGADETLATKLGDINIRQSGEDTIMTFDNASTKIVLDKFTASDLDSSMFDFV